MFQVAFGMVAPLWEGEPISEFVQVIDGEIREVSTATIVGRLSAILVQVDRSADAAEGLFDIMDGFSGELAEYYSVLFRSDRSDYKDSVRRQFIDIMHRDLLIIDRVTIEPAFRGRRLGLLSVCRLVDVFGESCGLVALKPFPLQFAGHSEPSWRPLDGLGGTQDGFSTAMAKLRGYWMRAGFERVNRTDYYALCPAAKRPGIRDLGCQSKQAQALI